MAVETLTSWQTEAARGIFLLAGAGVAFLGVWISQHHQARRDRENDERALRDAQRQRLESALLPVLLSARAMWELVLRQGKRPDQVEISEERDYLARLWQRATTDVEESVVILSLESDPRSAKTSEVFETVRSEFFAYLAYRSEGASDAVPALTEKVMISREAVFASLQELETLSQQQLTQLSQPISSKPRRSILDVLGRR